MRKKQQTEKMGSAIGLAMVGGALLFVLFFMKQENGRESSDG